MQEVDKHIFKELRINNRIFAKEIRLVGDKGEQLGVMPTMQALETARKNSLDLVEVAPTSVPPVCRLLDYGKYKYEQTKKEQRSRKGQKLLLLRQIRLRPKIGDHDFDAKARTAKKLLAGGDKVRVAIIFRGREITHPEIGRNLLKRMAEFLSETGSVEGQPVFDGRQMSIMVIPSAKTKVKEEKKEAVNAKTQDS